MDDSRAIAGNASIRHLGAVGRVLWPSEAATTSGRPLLNLSFALNWAIGGGAVLGYHLVNLAIHVSAAGVLYGLVRRTARSERLALGVALLWMLHPLNTEAVTYLSQRAESLAALGCLVMLYGLSRDALGLAVLGAAAAMATKENMVVVPLLAVLYDAAFRRTRRPWGYYAALAACCLGFAWIVCASGSLAHPSVGLHTHLASWRYLLGESRAILLYLHLAIWPHPLIFDYGPEWFTRPWQADVLPAAVVAILFIASLLTWRKNRPVGFLCTSFFVLLAPTSSLIPVAYDPVAESRMYLPLAALITLLAAAFRRMAEKSGGGAASTVEAAPSPLPFRCICGGLICVAAAVATIRRNHDYRSALALWTDTVAKRPESSRGHYSLARELAHDPAQRGNAISEYQAAIRILPDYPEAQSGMADILATYPTRRGEALALYRQAIQERPDYAIAHNNLGNLLAATPGQEAAALTEYHAAIAADPEYPKAHYNLANLLTRSPEGASAAILEYQTALRLDPAYALAANNLGVVYEQLGRIQDARAEYQAAVQADPAYPPAKENLARLGR